MPRNKRAPLRPGVNIRENKKIEFSNVIIIRKTHYLHWKTVGQKIYVEINFVV